MAIRRYWQQLIYKLKLLFINKEPAIQTLAIALQRAYAESIGHLLLTGRDPDDIAILIGHIKQDPSQDHIAQLIAEFASHEQETLFSVIEAWNKHKHLLSLLSAQEWFHLRAMDASLFAKWVAHRDHKIEELLAPLKSEIGEAVFRKALQDGKPLIMRPRNIPEA